MQALQTLYFSIFILKQSRFEKSVRLDGQMFLDSVKVIQRTA